jgi:fructan beta-fructosidase
MKPGWATTLRLVVIIVHLLFITQNWGMFMQAQAQTETRYTEPYRPQFHFSPAANWTNDPNGLVYYQGEYHLFYQYYPEDIVWGPMHWGHAVSPDLIHWTHLPIALYPDKIGEIWSGSAVADVHNTSGLVPGGGLIAIFSYRDQSQGIAYSRDKGRTWAMYEHNPVIPVGGKNFRDPKVVWHTASKQWVMIIAADDRVKLYGSPNLITWTFLSDFGSNAGSHASVWECPDLFPLTVEGQTKWVLTTSLHTREIAGAQYFIGHFDGTTFTNDNPPSVTLWLDHGPDNYAGVTFNDTPDGARVFVGWMSNWSYAKLTPTAVWRGAMTLPRALTLKRTADGLRLIQQPVSQFAALRGPVQSWHNQTITPGHNPLAGVKGRLLEIVAEFQPGSAASFGLRVHQRGDEQFTTIGYNVTDEKMFLERFKSGRVDFASNFADLYQTTLKPVNGRIKLHLIVDWSSVEVFGNDGEAVITAQVFPDETSDGLEVFAVGGDAQLVALDVYPIRRAWPE